MRFAERRSQLQNVRHIGCQVCVDYIDQYSIVICSCTLEKSLAQGNGRQSVQMTSWALPKMVAALHGQQELLGSCISGSTAASHVLSKKCYHTKLINNRQKKFGLC